MSANPSTLAFLVLRRGRTEWPCAGYGDLFFPPDGREKSHDKTERERRAVGLCACCPVITECLDEAEARGEQWGIWGGLTAGQRRARARARRSIAGSAREEPRTWA